MLCAGDIGMKETDTALFYRPYSPVDLWVCEQCLVLCKMHRYRVALKFNKNTK